MSCLHEIHIWETSVTRVLLSVGYCKLSEVIVGIPPPRNGYGSRAAPK